MDYITRTFEAQIDSVLEGERAVVARINSNIVDRLKTIIDPLGCDVSHFNKTRSVLWNHGLDPIRGMVPIGSGWAKVRKTERDMIGKTSFAKDEFSDLCFEGCKSGTLRGWSIKAGVHEASPPTRDEIRIRPELEDCETIYRRWDLIEFSLTPTPGNSDCVSLLVSRGLITAPEGFVPIETKPDPVLEEAIVRTATYIEGSGDKWAVHEASGKKIAEFRTMADAEELIRAMGQSRSFESVLTTLHASNQSRFEEQKEELLAEIMLRKWGVI